MPELITSVKNPRIKRLLELQQKSRSRKETGLSVVEGVREIGHCLEAGYELDTVFHCPDILPSLPPGIPQDRVVRVSAEVYARMAYREGTEGIIAEIKAKHYGPDNFGKLLEGKKNPLIMVLESVEKPGNLGAVLRSADAAQADAVVICDPLTDIFNPNLIRASLGAVFTVPVITCTSEEAIDFLKSQGIQILTAQLQDSGLYYDTDMKRGTAIVMGTESTGLSQPWRDAADAHIRIPMLGRLDSLNVSVSAAILLFEAVRQRS